MSTPAKRLLINVLLVLLVAGLAGWLWWDAQQPEQQSERLVPLSRAQVSSVLITRPQAAQQTIKLQKHGQHWRLQQPWQMDANPTRITQLFTLLDEPVSASYSAAERDLSQYGLAPAQLELQFNQHLLALGDTNPVSKQRYFLQQGQLQLASETVFGLLNGDVLAFASLQLVPYGRSLQAIDLPEGYASKAELLQNWRSATAIRLEVMDTATAQGDRIVLHLDDNSKLELELLAGSGELVLLNRSLGIRYILPEVQRQNLLPQDEA